MILTDPAAMRRAVAAVFPELENASIVVHDGGWDSVAIELDGAWICKFPRDADGLGALQREAAILAAIRHRLPVAVPDMAVIAGPPLFTRHAKLAGTTLSSAGYDALDDAARARLAGEIAGFLAALHAIDADWAALGVDAEAEDDDADPRDGLARLAPALRGAAEQAIAAHAALGADPLGSGFCHLDAHGGNFAFDPVAWRLNGIFDFGDAAIADRHEEFVEPAYISRDCAARVIRAYQAATGRAVDRARVETLIGIQRLAELADDGDHPIYGEQIRAQAADWFGRPTLA